MGWRSSEIVEGMGRGSERRGRGPACLPAMERERERRGSAARGRTEREGRATTD